MLVAWDFEPLDQHSESCAQREMVEEPPQRDGLTLCSRGALGQT